MDRPGIGTGFNRRLLLPLIGGLLIWLTLSAAWPHLAPSNPDGLTILGYALTAAVFVAAGGVQVARARITGQAVFRWSAAALLLAGSAILLFGAVSALTGPTAPGEPRPLPARWALVLVPALALLWIGARAHGSAAGRPARRTFLALGAAYAVTGLALSTPSVRTGLQHDDRSTAWLVVAAVAVAGWSLLAARTAARRHGPCSALRALAFALTAASSTAYAVGLRVDTAAADRVAAGLALAAASVALTAASTGLRAALADSSRRTLRLDADLDRIQRLLQQAEQRDAERRHDARTAALGLEAALAALAESGRHPGLTGVVTAELGRLVGLLDGATGEPARAFALAESLGPVITAHRLTGLPIVADPADWLGVHAFGRPRAMASALANVLTNAARHAPRATVSVRVFRAGHTVAVVVDDDGPGIPATEREAVVLRGTRGPDASAPGSGLGLYTASRALAEQGGRLHLAERPGGGTRVVLTLPATGHAATDTTPPASDIALAG